MQPAHLNEFKVTQAQESELALGVAAWLDIERQVNLLGMPEALEPSGDNVRTFMLAAEEELHEFGRELNWRPWHKSLPIDPGKALKEYADVMAFVALLGVYLKALTHVTDRQIAEKFVTVSKENAYLLLKKRGLTSTEDL
jgi:hypothetical protein